MKRNISLIITALAIIVQLQCDLHAQPSVNISSAKLSMQPGNPSSIKIGGYIGNKIDLCIEHRVKAQDIGHIIAPFYNKTETRLWQSEFWGKWMLGAIASYRYSHDPALRDSIDKAVTGLLGSQLPNGYIGNYAESSQLQHWDIWGRKYSMLGLLSYYELTGDKKILQACRKVADHLMTQIGPGKTDIVATGNYFGMASSSVLEPIVYLYRQTGESKYLDFARYIVSRWETDKGPKLISKAEAGVPVGDRFPHPSTLGQEWFSPYNGQKAYEMMSCYEGLLELYKITGEQTYLSATEKTVRSIIDTEINIAGSGSAFESWYHGREQQTRPTYHTMETCVTMTWMKLCMNLLCLTGNPLYADQIEKTTCNALIASMKADGTQIAMYSPLQGQRHPGNGQCQMNINCCNANGPRAFALLPQFAVTNSDNEIFVNLYSNFSSETALPSGKRIILKQQTAYPDNGIINIQLSLDKPESFTLALRIPEWSTHNSISVNGLPVDKNITPGSYHKINRQWKKGDTVSLELDVSARTEHQNGHVAIVKGPIVLARCSSFNDGPLDESAVIATKDNRVELLPMKNKPAGMWLAYTAPLIMGTDIVDSNAAQQIHFCDFASAGSDWSPATRYRVWIEETLNVIQGKYTQY